MVIFRKLDNTLSIDFLRQYYYNNDKEAVFNERIRMEEFVS